MSIPEVKYVNQEILSNKECVVNSVSSPTGRGTQFEVKALTAHERSVDNAMKNIEANNCEVLIVYDEFYEEENQEFIKTNIIGLKK